MLIGLPIRILLTLNIGTPIIQRMTTPLNIQFTISGLRKAGLTQAQIGDAVGLKQPTISDMESGKCGVKRPSHGLVTGLTALAEKYGVALTPKRKRKPRQATPP